MAAPIRVGIIGVGWGAIVQAPAFRAVPEYELVALCSRRPERVAEAAKKLEVAETSTDWRVFVQRDDLDLISVCTPVDLHAEQTIAAVAAGKHVLCEKPVAIDADTTRHMLEAAESAGVAHAICFENRYDPVRLSLRDEITAGGLGTPYFARAHTSADYWHPTRGLQSEWMYRVREGGGYLMGMASHDIDFLCDLFGEPEAVCADVRTTVSERVRPDGTTLAVDADDTSAVVMRMKSGMVALVSCSAVAFGANDRVLELAGSDGRIVVAGGVQEGGVEVLAQRVDDAEARVVPPSNHAIRSGYVPKRRAAGAIRSLALMLEDWLPALSESGATPGVPTLRDGLRVQQVIDAAREKLRGRRLGVSR